MDPESENAMRPMGDRVGFAYRGVTFGEWLDLFLEYATGLAHAGKFQQAYSVCESARDAIMFANSKDDLFVIHVAWAGESLPRFFFESRPAANKEMLVDSLRSSCP